MLFARRAAGNRLRRTMRTRASLRDLLSAPRVDDSATAALLEDLPLDDLLVVCEALEGERLLRPGETWGVRAASVLARLTSLPTGHSEQGRAYAVLDRHLGATSSAEAFSLLQGALPVRWRRAETVALHPSGNAALLALAAARGAFPGHSFGMLEGTAEQRSVVGDVLSAISPSACSGVLDLTLALLPLSAPGDMVGDAAFAATCPQVLALQPGQVRALTAMALNPVLSSCSAGFHLGQLPETAGRFGSSTASLSPGALEVLVTLLGDVDEATPFDQVVELARLVSP